MMNTEKKIQKASENFDLTASEVRKVMAAAKKRNRGKLIEFESWFTSGANEWGFHKVECHVYDPLNDERLEDVIIHCCLFDRRKSWVM